MKIIKNNFLIIFIFVIIISCKQKNVIIVDHSKSFYDKEHSYNKDKYLSLQNKQKNITKYQVQKGDNLYSVATKLNVDLRDLIEENNLNAPYFLKDGQFLKLPENIYYQILDGDNLYSVSRKLGIDIAKIISMNNLEEPYLLKAGQKIKVPINSNHRKNSLANIEDKIINSKDIKISQEKKDNFVRNIFKEKFSWPIKGTIISHFGPKPNGLYNDGINIKAETKAIVKSAKDGVVAYVGNELKGYGNLIIIKHEGGFITAYAHLDTILVKRLQKVKEQEQIALAGSSGNVNSSQLYFGLRKGRDAIDPENYLIK